MISESWELTVLNQTIRRKDESEEAWQARQAKAIADINSHSLVLFHALIQVPPLPLLGSTDLGGSDLRCMPVTASQHSPTWMPCHVRVVSRAFGLRLCPTHADSGPACKEMHTWDQSL